jgi:hypothetical protein
MDAIGGVIAASLVIGVFVLFDAAVRIVCGAVGELRYSVAPTMVGGLRAWVEERRAVEPAAGVRPTGPGGGEPPPGDGEAGAGWRARDGALVIPVTPVRRMRAAR